MESPIVRCVENPKGCREEDVWKVAGDMTPELRGRTSDASKLVKDLFSEADEDSDGYISSAELMGLFSRVGDGVVEKAKAVLTHCESKGDWSCISHERFIEIFLSVALSIPDDAYVPKDSNTVDKEFHQLGAADVKSSIHSRRESRLPSWSRRNKRHATLLPLSVASVGANEGISALRSSSKELLVEPSRHGDGQLLSGNSRNGARRLTMAPSFGTSGMATGQGTHKRFST